MKSYLNLTFRWSMKNILCKLQNLHLFQVIGSSLLLIYDKQGNIGVWLIDFSKARKIEEGRTITHRAEWKLGNSEDGCLTGLDNLIQVSGL